MRKQRNNKLCVVRKEIPQLTEAVHRTQFYFRNHALNSVETNILEFDLFHTILVQWNCTGITAHTDEERREYKGG